MEWRRFVGALISFDSRESGMTFVELLIGALLLAVALASLLGASLGQLTLNEHARNVMLATNDANRVFEQLRRQNSGGACATPSVTPVGGFASWDAWLTDTTVNGGGGKSLVNPTANSLMVVASSGTDPLQVTVSVCWRHRNRTIGECAWNGTTLSANPGAGGDPTVTESPTLLTTLLTCRN